jgi:hypothetical protein
MLTKEECNERRQASTFSKRFLQQIQLIIGLTAIKNINLSPETTLATNERSRIFPHFFAGNHC